MKNWSLGVVLAAFLVSAAYADSIDDAEAKRRGVPVIVIQLEKQLSVEKSKQTALQKQITDAQKKLADVTAVGSLPPMAMPSSLDPQLPKPSNGLRKANPAFDEIVAHYMAGNWSKLLAEIGAKSGQLTGLPAGNAADIAYIRAAMTECRPAWWEKIKTGSPFSFEVTVFNHKIPVNWSPANAVTESAGVRGGKVSAQVAFPPNWIDNTGPYDTNNGLSLPSGTFTAADMNDFVIWTAVSREAPMIDLGDKGAAMLEKSEERYVDLHRQFLGNVAAMYYVNPNARYVALAECQNAFDDNRRTAVAWNGRRYFTAFLVWELMAHPEKYPTLKLEIPAQPDECPAKMLPEQYLLTSYLSSPLMGKQFTFAEDCALRQAIWEFAMANTDWTADHIELPNGCIIALDAAKETEAAKARWTAYQKLTLPKATQPVEAPQTAPAQ